VKQVELDAAMAVIRNFRGDVIQTTLSAEVEESLRRSLERE
jgi:uncharacterized membrane protein